MEIFIENIASESHSNTTIHQFEAMNPFSRCLVMPQYFYFKYRGIPIPPTPTWKQWNLAASYT